MQNEVAIAQSNPAESGCLSELCVVHLVWAPLGTEPFKNFLSSYSAHRAGLDHELLILFNGFKQEGELKVYNQLLSGYRHKTLLLDEPALDISSYFVAIKNFKCRYYCFLNSYSRILADNWLYLLYLHASNPRVGVAGATGSWESMYTNCLNEYNIKADSSLYKKVRAYSRHHFRLLKLKMYFERFPNYHIRTNGFMISRETMLTLRKRPIRHKMDAYRFESGKKSLTSQVLALNRQALVVGKNGKGYQKEEWSRSGTFKQGNQENLLIADNQTDRYGNADPVSKERLYCDSWGRHV